MKRGLTLKWSKMIKAYKLFGDKCQICGDQNIYHFVFHHLDPNEKEEELGNIWNKRWSIIEKEIKKCILLCDCCHRELHFNEGTGDDRRKNKEIFISYKGNKCEKCGYDKCIASLTFHHENDENKEFNIGAVNIRFDTLNNLNESIINELDKCELLCGNCHREKHVDIEFVENNIEEIREKITTYKETQKKISREKVYEMFDSGIKQVNIAKYFNASKGTICDILKNRKMESKPIRVLDPSAKRDVH